MMMTTTLPPAMHRFGWLLRREWMQHHRGWLILAVLPMLLALLMLAFGDIQVDALPPPALLAALGLQVYVAAVLLLAWAAVWFQAPGMARRDQQDRSIEFWLSLPTGHWQSVTATLLMHLLAMPMLVLLIAFACGQLVAMLLLVRLLGLSSVGELGLAAWLAGSAVALLRLLVGVALCALWSAPLVLMAMAAAAWLKRWGVPALAAAIGMGGLVLQQTTGSPVIWQTVSFWFNQATQALLPLAWPDFKQLVIDQVGAAPAFQQWLWQDIGRVLAALATREFALGMLFAALGFVLLVWRRAGGLPWPGVLAGRTG